MILNRALSNYLTLVITLTLCYTVYLFIFKQPFTITPIILFVVGAAIAECIRFFVLKSNEKKDDTLKK